MTGKTTTTFRLTTGTAKRTIVPPPPPPAFTRVAPAAPKPPDSGRAAPATFTPQSPADAMKAATGAKSAASTSSGSPPATFTRAQPAASPPPPAAKSEPPATFTTLQEVPTAPAATFQAKDEKVADHVDVASETMPQFQGLAPALGASNVVTSDRLAHDLDASAADLQNKFAQDAGYKDREDLGASLKADEEARAKAAAEKAAAEEAARKAADDEKWKAQARTWLDGFVQTFALDLTNLPLAKKHFDDAMATVQRADGTQIDLLRAKAAVADTQKLFRDLQATIERHRVYASDLLAGKGATDEQTLFEMVRAEYAPKLQRLLDAVAGKQDTPPAAQSSGGGLGLLALVIAAAKLGGAF